MTTEFAGSMTSATPRSRRLIDEGATVDSERLESQLSQPLREGVVIA